ncbi:adenylate kinase isoenzyme, putative [Entamoeba invadens IP1]|uniref:adenylate kinase isoenzyme, putative n=1 Tax=Entamoeba invadens IP1 TaxID=370355 RepID=UPI0002C3FA7B|nr:adenylate kinase isoenzyme, putative [Entamoeba invadens IP1]ELP90815.1 adenylate kinase isoenzyme, putative [Entamoeba invadens IP1]|eukprot:XP_004257586.1 adenylate kinase isoenzyme, putative [Entamoeba invadens IP1]
MSKGDRQRPNILVTGTPGTGKSLVCQMVTEKVNINYVNVGDVVTQNGFYESRDEEMDTLVIDEDKVLDYLEDVQKKEGFLLEYHSSQLFPERWFDLVVVLRTDNTVLYDRLLQKGYKENKVTNNLDCEIFQVCLDEAMENYQHKLVWEVHNETPEQLEEAVDAIAKYITLWPKSFGLSFDQLKASN